MKQTFSVNVEEIGSAEVAKAIDSIDVTGDTSDNLAAISALSASLRPASGGASAQGTLAQSSSSSSGTAAAEQKKEEDTKTAKALAETSKLVDTLTKVLANVADLTSGDADAFVSTLAAVTGGSQPQESVTMNAGAKLKIANMLEKVSKSATLELKDAFTQAVANMLLPPAEISDEAQTNQWKQDGGSVAAKPDKAQAAIKDTKAVMASLAAHETFLLSILSRMDPTKYDAPIETSVGGGQLTSKTGFMQAPIATPSSGTEVYVTTTTGGYAFDIPLSWVTSPTTVFNSVSHKTSPYRYTAQAVSGGVGSFSLFDRNKKSSVSGRKTCARIRSTSGPAEAPNAATGTVTHSVNKSAPLLLEFKRTAAQMEASMHLLVEPFLGGNSTYKLDAFLGTAAGLGIGSVGAEFDFTFQPLSVRTIDSSMSSFGPWLGDINQTIAHRSHVLQILPHALRNSVCRDNTSVAHSGPRNTEQTYYLVLRTESPDTIAVNVNVRHLQCLFMVEKSDGQNVWRDFNCTPSPMSTPGRLQCHCNHLTVFAGMESGDAFAKPNVVKVRAIIADDIANNPVVFVPVIFLWIFFLLLMQNAYKRDQVAELAQGPVWVASNKSEHRGRFEITVRTGIRFNASISHETRVYITMFGSSGRTVEIALTHAWRPLFQRGAADVFLVTTPSNIGAIQRIHIRQDGNDSFQNPTWFLSGLEIVNLHMPQDIRYFFLGKWLAYNLGDCQLGYDITGLSWEAAVSWKRTMSARITKSVSESHTVMSVFLCPPTSKFNRVERTMTLMTFLCGSLFANGFFYQGDQTELNVAQTITTGVMASFMVIIPLSIVLFFFQNSAVVRKELGNSNGKTWRNLKSPKVAPAMDTEDEADLEEILGQKSKRWTSHAVRKDIQKRVSVVAESKGVLARMVHAIGDYELPAWCKWIGWLLALGICFWSSYYVLLLSFEWGPTTSWMWLSAVFCSVFMLSAITDPLYILFFAGAMTFIFGFQKQAFSSAAGKDGIVTEKILASNEVVLRLAKARKKHALKYETTTPERLREKRRDMANRDLKMSRIFWDIVRYLVFYACVIVVFMQSHEQDKYAFTSVGSVLDSVGRGHTGMQV